MKSRMAPLLMALISCIAKREKIGRINLYCCFLFCCKLMQIISVRNETLPTFFFFCLFAFFRGLKLTFILIRWRQCCSFDIWCKAFFSQSTIAYHLIRSIHQAINSTVFVCAITKNIYVTIIGSLGLVDIYIIVCFM